MAMFDQAFRTHIKNELEYRREFDGVQAVLHPHVINEIDNFISKKILFLKIRNSNVIW